MSCTTKSDTMYYSYAAETTINTDTTLRNNEKFNWEPFNIKTEKDITFCQENGNTYTYMT